MYKRNGIWKEKHWKKKWESLSPESKDIIIVDAIVAVLDLTFDQLWTCPITELDEVIRHNNAFYSLTKDKDYLMVKDLCEEIIAERYLTGES